MIDTRQLEDAYRHAFLRERLRGYHPQSEKHAILGEMRELEVRLGLKSQPYNSNDF